MFRIVSQIFCKPATRNRKPPTYNLNPAIHFLYLASMRTTFLLTAALLFMGCGGSHMNARLARKLIADNPQSLLNKKDVEVVRIIQPSGSEAIAETTLRTAFRFQKVGDRWEVKEIRIGHGQWEKIDNLEQALARVKIDKTRKMLDRIAEAILRYRKSNGKLPVFKDYVSLSDLLSPKYLTPLIRLDAWRRPLAAKNTDSGTILLSSAGPDGKPGTGDDIFKTVHP